MNAINILQKEFQILGYSSHEVINNYSFADILDNASAVNVADVAVFTQTPASYRTAAFGVVVDHTQTGYNEENLRPYKSLGAPIVFVVSESKVRIWQTREKQLLCIGTYSIDQLPSLFTTHKDTWNPERIHRAKSIGLFNREYQLDFVDIGLMQAIEGEIYTKLDRLLNTVITQLRNDIQLAGREPNYKSVFQLTFRLLAAKILIDCNHPHTSGWNINDVNSIIVGISKYYNLDSAHLPVLPGAASIFTQAWQTLINSICFRNISADDLALVYENTLVTPETRKSFGTHSTPRRVAEYVTQRLDVARYDIGKLKIYEPFCGAGVFLVSAIRHFKEILPREWSEKQRHDFLIDKISGDEIDPFACEVATLSLILADYPNANGWKIAQSDLFLKVQSTDIDPNTIILCNPPFEDFDEKEKSKYPDAIKLSVHKPIAALESVLKAKPLALGFVLPRGFIQDNRYARIREKIGNDFSSIEVVALPDKIFNVSSVESSLLIAKDRSKNSKNRLISTVVSDADRVNFLKTGHVTSQRAATKLKSNNNGDLWLVELFELWDYLASNPKLLDIAEVHRGLEWQYKQNDAFSSTPLSGYKQGLLAVDYNFCQFNVRSSGYLDCRTESQRGKAFLLPWDSKKIIINGTRLSRKGWKLAAYTDSTGLVCSQNFMGIWLKPGASFNEVTLEAILNNPITSAFLDAFNDAQRFTVNNIKQIPLPKSVDPELVANLVSLYRETLCKNILDQRREDTLKDLIMAIDAEVLASYDLPPKLEKALLDRFAGRQRPVSHHFSRWFPENFESYISLKEYISPQYKNLQAKPILERFASIPEKEGKALNQFLDKK